MQKSDLIVEKKDTSRVPLYARNLKQKRLLKMVLIRMVVIKLMSLDVLIQRKTPIVVFMFEVSGSIKVTH